MFWQRKGLWVRLIEVFGSASNLQLHVYLLSKLKTLKSGNNFHKNVQKVTFRKFRLNFRKSFDIMPKKFKYFDVDYTHNFLHLEKFRVINALSVGLIKNCNFSPKFTWNYWKNFIFKNQEPILRQIVDFITTW